MCMTPKFGASLSLRPEYAVTALHIVRYTKTLVADMDRRPYREVSVILAHVSTVTVVHRLALVMHTHLWRIPCYCVVWAQCTESCRGQTLPPSGHV